MRVRTTPRPPQLTDGYGHMITKLRQRWPRPPPQYGPGSAPD